MQASTAPSSSRVFPINATVNQALLPQHWQPRTAFELLEIFEQHPLEFHQIPQYFPKPSIDDYDMIAIYSLDAQQKLRQMLTTTSVTMMVSGGSSLTGVHAHHLQERTHHIFANLFYNVSIVERAHGTRNSFHSMALMHSFFPARVVYVVLWEFAINDGVANRLNDQSIGDQEQRNQFILYLEQLARVAKERQQEPPLVILLYLWSTPQRGKHRRLYQHVFESHRHLAEQYDFVVGQVNAAKYVSLWSMSGKNVKRLIFADIHHPNHRGHMILAYLLQDLVMNEQRREKPKQQQQNATFTWVCGNETREKRLLRDILVHRHPVASFTEELPKNEELLPGMLHPILVVNNNNPRVETRGKINTARLDRQNCVVLPCCRSNTMLTFDLSQLGPIHGILVNFSPNDNGTTIVLDGQNITAQLIRAKSWRECLLSLNGGLSTYLADWIALEQERQASNISFCNHLPECATQPPPDFPPLALMSLAVFGGKR